jgi:CheY-like chemotaxis protein
MVTATRASVLVVDDEDMVRNFMRRVLEEEGYQVLVATNGDEALSILGTFAISLVVTDIKMPVMSGTDLGARVAALPGGTQVVYASASDVPPEGVEFSHYLQKPFTREDLRATVAAILQPT